MALFGFNKQKVLASAEKYVQQGKLQNAISEYEKILKNDAKDLTVTNTVGDLYSRLGETDKATECFKSVGDAYAGQGFTVKAIAMYKKICKLKPSLESLLKLAELYTQQGLFNDARAQYLQVAEEFLKSGELENAVRIFQKILEMDPENSSMRIRLAEVYVRLGKKNDAWQIFTQAAESLRSKGSLNEAEEVLHRMLKLDPNNTYALLMQGRNLLESGDAAAAVTTLQKIPDIDSNAEGLRDLLKAYLQAGQLSEAGTAANKLLTVHNDLSAISSFADALMQAGQYENALQVFDQHAERLLAENSSKVLQSLHAIIGHVRENPDSLQKLLDLFNKGGDSSHVSEVMELLAHASVQSGDLTRSRDLYQKLAQVEPQNPLHLQNYQQVVSQLSGISGNKLITPEEAIVLLDDLEATAPAIHQHYSDEVALAVRSALTDAELFISYNMPAKALGPLIAVLPQAPDDLRINQRLATLHTRAGRFAEAAVCCRTLQRVYSEADYPEEATRYGELAERYEERTTTVSAATAEEEAPIFIDAPAAQGSDHAEVAVDEAPVEAPAAEPEPAEEQQKVGAKAASPWPTQAGTAAEPEFAVVDETASTAAQASGPAEIDLSSEWDDALTVEAEAPVEQAVEQPAEEPAELEAAPVSAAPAAKASVPMADAAVDEAAEEIRFYIGHSMLEQAMATLAKLQTLTKDKARLDGLRAEIEAASAEAAEQETPAAPEPVFEELTADDVPAFDVVEESPAAEEPTAVVAEPEPVEEAPIVAEVPVEPVVAKPEPVAPKPAPVVRKPASAPPVVQKPEPVQPAVLKKFVTDLESSLGDGFLPGTVSKPAPPAAIAPVQPQAAAAAAPSAPVLGEFVADIEASLGEDFLAAAPVPEPETPVAKAVPVPPAVPPAAPKISPLAVGAAASAAPTSHVAAPAPVTRPSVAAPSAISAPVISAPKPQPPASVLPPAAPAAASKVSPFGEDAGVDLAEMFGELKQDLEADVASADEDPETHYNLGIAFREMGLLDEAIGELQKACQSFDKGHPFPQIMQTYTWLAQCFLEKGVPEAAVRWYEKALNVPTIDGETRTALNYELASAYEAAGDKPSALKHFMDVYGSNIDYRDVAERIKVLKS